MTDQLRISILQRQLHWENIDANLAMFADHIQLLPPQSTDLIVLPEMFTTGFSMNPSALAEPMTGKTVKWMEQMAKGSEAVVCGSAIIEENGHYFNRLIWMPPDGEFEVYDKRHCFTLAGEDQYYQSGDSRLIVTWKGWKICPLICYDLRFPVWSRNTDDYDLLV